ncbi:biotin-dependent carboxyltransferase family protein [Halomonas huangheensis]|uniref:Carboxyltransferase domain-containing protein n=1 Tax=Halomonas huangheensis TaxID=1178482 RepID=W1N8W0_9GAMM|nr:biotin-dependent carboxyltransferase family protein [Halomonas huangheensis]ALM53412.1 allophanate hydrolase [Halomonas huangheensis]ERL51924.1 hypothetical protein BJB45_12210 [Halomonas huangheensis]
MTLRVERAGPLALVVDGGRSGVRHLGVTQGGAMDWVALGWANWLLGNAPDTAGIEIMVGGLTLIAEAPTPVALAGADLAATVDGERVAPGQALSMQPGQRLAFQGPQQGLRAYLAIPGGIQAEAVMGSVSSTVREGLGGLDGHGQPLREGDTLVAAGSQASQRQLPDDIQQTSASGEVRLGLVLGAQSHGFTGSSLFRAFHQKWQVDQRADRMGIRLTGTALECSLKGMVSEGIPWGAVQVPPDGQPIILMNDRQTIGGYPRLGALTPLACARLAQCLPGATVRFTPTTPERARRDYLQQLAMWQR